MAACNPGTSEDSSSNTTPQVVTWSNGSPITNVMHVSGSESNGVLVVTEDGSAYKGVIGSVSETPIIESGAISVSGGFNSYSQCVVIENGDRKDLRCGQQLTRPALPEDFDVMQVTAAYGFMCALNKQGEVWCWTGQGSVPGLQDIIGATPAKLPFDEPMVFISAGQNAVCGTKQSGGITCTFSLYDQPFLQAAAQVNPAYTPDDFHPNGKAFQAGYKGGVAINEDGSAVYYKNGQAVPLSIMNVAAAGGDRGAMSVVTENGDVYLIGGGTATKVEPGMKAQAAACPL